LVDFSRPLNTYAVVVGIHFRNNAPMTTLTKVIMHYSEVHHLINQRV
jgi:hypothetical protein